MGPNGGGGRVCPISQRGKTHRAALGPGGGGFLEVWEREKKFWAAERRGEEGGGVGGGGGGDVNMLSGLETAALSEVGLCESLAVGCV